MSLSLLEGAEFVCVYAGQVGVCTIGGVIVDQQQQGAAKRCSTIEESKKILLSLYIYIYTYCYDSEI